MRRASLFWRVAVLAMGSAWPVHAEVPTAAWPEDDADSPPAPASSPSPIAPPANSMTQPQPGPAPATVVEAQVGATNQRPVLSPTPVSGTTSSIKDAPSELVASSAAPSTGFSRLKIAVKDPGSIVYVLPHRDDPEELPADAALMKCTTSCTSELPQGMYSIRVVTEEGVVSHGQLTLKSARWVTIAPARQVARDIGFVMGAVGAVSTILGGALLADAICEKNCTNAARDTLGAVALGVGIPLVAIGWSLYVVNRKASVEEQVLSQEASSWRVRPTISRLPRGATLGLELKF